MKNNVTSNGIGIGIVEGMKMAVNPVGYLISVGVEKAEQRWKEVNETGDKKAIAIEFHRQEAEAKIRAMHAEIEQELAIARRIDAAEEVIIEEFYDMSGEGKAGLNLDENSLSFGINGAGRKVTKRVYTFKGKVG